MAAIRNRRIVVVHVGRPMPAHQPGRSLRAARPTLTLESHHLQLKFALPGLALALALVPAAVAQSPNKPPNNPPRGATAITIAAEPAVVVVTGATTLSGRLTGAKAAVVVRLEHDTTRPYGDAFTPTGNTMAVANNGMYAFTVKPLLNTHYRVVAQAAPLVTSAAALVRVRMRVGLTVSDLTPRRGSLVRSPDPRPPHTTGVPYRSRGGRRRWLHDRRTDHAARCRETRSTYSRRVRVSRDGVYRVKVTGDVDHINGLSCLRTLNVPG